MTKNNQFINVSVPLDDNTQKRIQSAADEIMKSHIKTKYHDTLIDELMEKLDSKHKNNLFDALISSYVKKAITTYFSKFKDDKIKDEYRKNLQELNTTAQFFVDKLEKKYNDIDNLIIDRINDLIRNVSGNGNYDKTPEQCVEELFESRIDYIIANTIQNKIYIATQKTLQSDDDKKDKIIEMVSKILCNPEDEEKLFGVIAVIDETI